MVRKPGEAGGTGALEGLHPEPEPLSVHALLNRPVMCPGAPEVAPEIEEVSY